MEYCEQLHGYLFHEQKDAAKEGSHKVVGQTSHLALILLSSILLYFVQCASMSENSSSGEYLRILHFQLRMR